VTVGAGDRPQDTFRYRPEEVQALAERFTLEPVPPATIADRIDGGAVLATTDVPDYLGRPIASDADASITLYRLVQLFGTPNAPGLEAGADQPQREKRTWQYLFHVTDHPDEGEEREHLLSAYDHRTDLSVGVSEWHHPEAAPRWPIPEASADPLPSGSMPPEADLEALVQLVLSTVEHAVEATYKDLYV